MRKILFVGIAIATLSLGSLFHSSNAAAATTAWQNSVMIQPRSSTDFASSTFDQSVKNAVNDGANYIVLVIPIHQSNIYSTDVAAGTDTPTDQSIISAVTYIHGLGAHVALSIHDDSYDGQWRAYINPSDRTTWFNNYGNQLRHYATLAQSSGTEEMVLGTEMTSMTSPSYNSTNTSNWVSMIQSVRLIYSGKLTYSAQHDGYYSDLASIGFWSQLDYIGVSAYYGMGNDSSVSAIASQWQSIDQNDLAPLASKYGKQILFTEIGYASKSGSLSDPGTAYEQGGGVDLTLQANAYSALFSYWKNSTHFAGVALWDWSSDPNAGGSGNSDYTPQNKPAETIMKQGFTNGGGMGSGTTTSASATYQTSASVSANPTVGTLNTITASVAASSSTTGKLVDIEVYNASGQRVAQQYYDNQTLSTTATPFTLTWTPAASGTYSVKVGVFTTGWQSSLVWNDSAASVSVIAANTSPAPVNTSGSGSTTTGSGSSSSTTSGSSSTTTTPATTNLSIWWPGNSQAVSGVQPFKALIDGMDLSKYNMYWQVDGGTLNAMANSSDGGIHKESLVDMSSWNWQSSGHYTINFVAKDSSGTIIAQKSVVITVTH